MQGEKQEEWQNLCRQATVEDDPERLLQIIDHINRMLWEKEQRLKQEKGSKAQSAA